MIYTENLYDIGDLEVDELYHSGVKGQRWGVRRWQNPDGSLTPAGIRRYKDSEVTRQRVKSAGKSALQIIPIVAGTGLASIAVSVFLPRGKNIVNNYLSIYGTRAVNSIINKNRRAADAAIARNNARFGG